MADDLWPFRERVLYRLSQPVRLYHLLKRHPLAQPIEYLFTKSELIYKKLIPSKNDTVVIYCHSGVRSAHTTFEKDNITTITK